MNKKWLLGGVAAFLAIGVLALVVGGVVGRSIVPAAEEPAPAPPPAAVEPQAAPRSVRFKDTLTDVSIAYPSTWDRRFAADQAVRLVASSPDASAAVSISVRRSNLETVTTETLPIVRSLTDDLLREDARIGELPEPEAVSVDGLPGYRYTYTYRSDGGGQGAHIHYFLFKADRVIQMVLQAVPASKLASLQPQFAAIAGTFRKGRS